MRQVKEVNIKNQTYYFFDDMVDIKNFHSNLSKKDKKLHKEIDVYYIGYITIKKFSDCEKIHSENPLYLIIHSATGYFKEENGEEYLIIDSTEKYEAVFLGLDQKLKHLVVERNCFVKKTMLELGLILTMIYR